MFFNGNWKESCGCQCGGYLPTTMTVKPVDVGLPPDGVGGTCEFELIGTQFGRGAKGYVYFPTRSDSPSAVAESFFFSEPGSCYAAIGRVAPTLKATAREEPSATRVIRVTVT